MDIPKIISQKAAEQGYNSVEYLGKRDDAQAFAVGKCDDDGNPLPTGLPTVFLLRGNEIEVIDGLNALALL